MTWPWYCDHDHFAELAQLWDSGSARPYRDVFSFQFPGEIYIFWALGKLFGWGNSVAFYAFDAILVVLFGVVLGLWSRRLFGRVSAGLIGYSAFLYHYLGLDYRLAAQRDWHAAFLALLGLLLPDLLAGRRGRIGSGVAFGLSLVFRPQMLLFLPALLLALDRSASSSKESARSRLVGLTEWSASGTCSSGDGLSPSGRQRLDPRFPEQPESSEFPQLSLEQRLRVGQPAVRNCRVSAFVLAPLLVVLILPSGRYDLIRRAGEIARRALGIAVYKLVSPVYHPYHEVPRSRPWPWRWFSLPASFR